MKNNSSTLFLSLILILFFTNSSSQESKSPPLIPNPRLFNAFIALQALKHAITDDPKRFTRNWHGHDVCRYAGVYCAPSPDDPHTTTVAGIDLNHGLITGTLPEELGLLTDLALFHINSNRFKGCLPQSFRNLRLLYEIDISNNVFSGEFPSVLLCLPSLKFIDIRYNKFSGAVPPELFDLKLDALFINNNDFHFTIPKNLGNSTVSVLVMANINLQGCLPPGIGKMSGTLNEIILTNSGLSACFPQEIGELTKLTVFDLSFNDLVGALPRSMANMKSLEQLNIAGNKLSGEIPEMICSLPRLENFTYAGNYFCGEPTSCLRLKDKDDARNCIPYRPNQRSAEECSNFYMKPVGCSGFGCLPQPSPLPPLSPPPPYYYHP